MNKIITILYLLIIISGSIYPQNFWERIASPTTQRLNSIVFIDSLDGWVASDSGVIIHTTNGGESWETQFSNDSLNVVNLFFLDNQTGWASAWSSVYEPYGTFILKTTNGGTDWEPTRLRVGEKFVNSFYFLDTSKGFAVGYPGLFMRTVDGGETWVDVNLDSAVLSGFPPYTVKFYNDQYGYASGGVRDIAGVVWRTTDGGIDWTTVVNNLTSEPVYDIHIFDSLNVIAMGGDPEYGASLVKTTDGGNTWNYTLLGTLWYPVDIGFRTATEGWGPMGAQRKFLYTSDAGESWSELSTPDSVNVIRISFPDTLHGFGIGENGEMVKYVYQKPNIVKSYPGKISSFYLSQNYPNPFNPTTNIEYQIPDREFVTLIVYDVLGNEVAILVNEEKPAGNYSVQFSAKGGSASGGDGSRLSSGIYFYKLISGQYISVKKMILLK